MQDRDGFEYSTRDVSFERDEEIRRVGEEGLPKVVKVRYVRSMVISPSRQARKELGLSGRQAKKLRKALRRKPKVTFTGPELVEETQAPNAEGLVS